MTSRRPDKPAGSSGKAAGNPKGASVAGGGRKTKRRVARELALQGLYQWCLAGGTAENIEAQLGENAQFARADGEYPGQLLKGVLADAQELEELIQPSWTATSRSFSPVETPLADGNARVQESPRNALSCGDQRLSSWPRPTAVLMAINMSTVCWINSRRS
jgi:hypothetical protein